MNPKRSTRLSLALIGIVAASLALTSCKTEEKSEATSLYEKISPSVLKIYGLSSKGGDSRAGTGFVAALKEGPAIVTNRHVVEGAEVVVVESASSVWFSAEWREHPDLDIAVLPLPKKLGISAIEVDFESLIQPGERVYTIGYPLGETLAIQQGIVSTTDGVSLVFSAPLSTGASGSPLLSARGEVIGLCHSYIPDAQNYNLALPSAFLAIPTLWVEKKSTVDPELMVYLDKIVEVKETVLRTTAEWASIATEFPEWKRWVESTERTRTPLLNAMESLVMAANSIEWSSVGARPSNTSDALIAMLLEKNALSLDKAWRLHQANLEASQPAQPAAAVWSLMSDHSLVPNLIASARNLSRAMLKNDPSLAALPSPGTGKDKSHDSKKPLNIEEEFLAVGSLVSALESYLLAEEKWSTGRIP